MATFKREDADIAAVYIRIPKSDGQSKLRRAPYNLVTYDDGTSGLEPVNTEVVFGTTNVTREDLEIDRIEVYDWDPHSTLNVFRNI